MPQSICNSCLENLAISYVFREMCFESQTKLQQLNEAESAFGLDSVENRAAELLGSKDPNLEQESCDLEYLGCDSGNSQEESVFNCGFCSKACTTKYALNRHLKVHSGAVELKCHICLKNFTR